ncbi:MAG: porin [Desulfovibrionaceae bacterium]|jgi:predicted porin|nr:porin [Desulfovibrionaceae bacterium]
MKKTLIALAVLGLSSAAMAQSSVTMYGVADAGLGKMKLTEQDAVLGAVGLGGVAGSADATNKTQFISASRMNNGDSRLGVRGVEDLGGGLKVGFNFETGLDLNNGGTSSGAFWGRYANVSVNGDWGGVKLGRQYTASYLVSSMYELTGTANYSVLGNTYNYAGVGIRTDSAFSYMTPTFNGFTAGLGFLSKNDNAHSNINVVDVGAMYIDGPIVVGLSFNKGTNGKTGFQLGGKYNFGSFALAASYTQAVIPGTDMRRSGFELGGTVKFGAFSATLDLTRDTKNEWNETSLGRYAYYGLGPVAGKKYTNGLLELKYALSKRTFVYGAYLRLDKTNNYSIGVNHSF